MIQTGFRNILSKRKHWPYRLNPARGQFLDFLLLFFKFILRARVWSKSDQRSDWRYPLQPKIKKNCFWQLAILFLRASRYTRFMRFVLLKRREICKRHNWVSANYDNKNRVCFLHGINKDLSSLLVWWRENLENQCPTPTRPPIVPIFGHWRPLSTSGFLVKVSSHTRAQTMLHSK